MMTSSFLPPSRTREGGANGGTGRRGRKASQTHLNNRDTARRLLAVLGLLVLAACSRAPVPAPHPASPGALPEPRLYTLTVPASPAAAPAQAGTAPGQGAAAAPSSPPPAATLPATLTPAFSPTPDPYAGLSIADLSGRSYGGGQIVVHETLAENSRFTRYLISYPSDGLEIYGFMNVPRRGQAPYPVVIALHGYIDPSIYQTLDYTTVYADALAGAGFLVLHPNLRGYPPSDEGDNLFRVGMAVDVLNLAAIVRAWGGQPGALESADPQRIGVWGHSMGGGVATRVITVDQGIRAAVLYGAMSGDEQKNFERIFNVFSDRQRGLEELGAPAEVYLRISPVYFLERIQAAVSIHHGDQDTEVPPEWSEDLCARLAELGKTVECYSYTGQPHTFWGEGADLFIQRTIEFYNRYLKE